MQIQHAWTSCSRSTARLGLAATFLVSRPRALPPFGTESFADICHDLDQQIDLGRSVVDIEAGPSAGSDGKPIVQRPRAVVTSSHGNALLVQKLGDIMRVRLR